MKSKSEAPKKKITLIDAVVVSAPGGRNAQRLAQLLRAHLNCTTVINDWGGVEEIPPGALVMTQLPVRRFGTVLRTFLKQETRSAAPQPDFTADAAATLAAEHNLKVEKQLAETRDALGRALNAEAHYRKEAQQLRHRLRVIHTAARDPETFE